LGLDKSQGGGFRLLERRAETRVARLRRRHFRKSRHVRFSQHTILTLQIVGEIQRSIGELAAKTDRLIADVKTQGDKLDRPQHQATFMKGGLAVSVFFITSVSPAHDGYLILHVTF
jgi:hypothetical protein